MNFLSSFGCLYSACFNFHTFNSKKRFIVNNCFFYSTNLSSEIVVCFAKLSRIMPDWKSRLYLCIVFFGLQMSWFAVVVVGVRLVAMNIFLYWLNKNKEWTLRFFTLNQRVVLTRLHATLNRYYQLDLESTRPIYGFILFHTKFVKIVHSTGSVTQCISADYTMSLSFYLLNATLECSEISSFLSLLA